MEQQQPFTTGINEVMTNLKNFEAILILENQVFSPIRRGIRLVII